MQETTKNQAGSSWNLRSDSTLFELHLISMNKSVHHKTFLEMAYQSSVRYKCAVCEETR
jgi:hypothetical protein